MWATLLMMAEWQSVRSKGGGDEGRGRKNERWDLQRLRTRTFLSSRHSPENAEAKQTCSCLTDGVFTCYLPQLVFLASPSACVCVWEGDSSRCKSGQTWQARLCWGRGCVSWSSEPGQELCHFWAALARCLRKMQREEAIFWSVGRCHIFHLSVDCSLTCDTLWPFCFFLAVTFFFFIFPCFFS